VFFQEDPQTVDSWTVIDSNIAVKKMDRSSFIHHGTGITRSIQMTWCRFTARHLTSAMRFGVSQYYGIQACMVHTLREKNTKNKK
jgi:hypothetical protein